MNGCINIHAFGFKADVQTWCEILGILICSASYLDDALFISFITQRAFAVMHNNHNNAVAVEKNTFRLKLLLLRLFFLPL